MTRITASDHILGLLRQQLERRQKSAKVAPQKTARTASPEKAATQRVLARLKADSNLDEAQQAQMIITALLTDRFGAGLVNDPQFQSLVGEVQAAMMDHPQTAALVKAAIEEAPSKGDF